MLRSLLFISLCCFFSCDLFDNEPDPIVDVPVEFQLKLFQEIRPDGRTLFFEVESVDTFECTNHSISGEVAFSPQRMVYALASIDAPEDCAPGNAPATARYSIDELNAGNYDLSVTLREVVENRGMLTLDAESVELNFDEARGINAEFVLKLLPENAAWGYVRYDADPTEVSSFLSELHALEHEVFNGEYGYFHAEGRNVHLHHSTESAPFALQLSAETDALRSLLDAYRNRLGDDFVYRVWLGNGAVIE